MRVLLLGGSGQIGWELKRLLPSAELAAPERSQADLAQPASLLEVMRAHRPEIVINAAAYTAVDAAEKDEAGATAANAEGPAALAREVARLGGLLVHYSTDYVFDGTARVPYREDDRPNPLSVYGRSKLAGEEAIRASGCRYLILRTSWVYAARGKNFLRTMLRLANERAELRVVVDQFGAPTWARSVAAATVQVLSHVAGSVRNDTGATYHMTCAGQTSWHGFAARIVERGASLGLCKKVPVHPITSGEFATPARRPAYSVLSNDRLLADFAIRLPEWGAALDECLKTSKLRR